MVAYVRDVYQLSVIFYWPSYLGTYNKSYICYFSNQQLCMESTLANKNRTAAINEDPNFSLALPWKSFINCNKQLQDIA